MQEKFGFEVGLEGRIVHNDGELAEVETIEIGGIEKNLLVRHHPGPPCRLVEERSGDLGRC